MPLEIQKLKKEKKSEQVLILYCATVAAKHTMKMQAFTWK